MPPGGTGLARYLTKGQAVAKLWWLGLWEALHVHRCVIFFVLDTRGEILAKVGRCFVVNGCIFLGSILWQRYALQPTVAWLLALVEPLYGTKLAGALESLLLGLFQAMWLMPAYILTLLVSCIWYQQVASLAFQVQQQRAVQQQGTAAAKASPTPKRGSGTIEGVAQELYRVIFFLVFYLEVAVMYFVPVVGPTLSFVFLSWLYAYYCYDYQWTLQGVSLPERLARFERHWAFFAGFGCPSTLASMFCSFYVGAAVLNVMFPLFILVAAETDLSALHSGADVDHNLGSIPIFAMAQWPTERLLRLGLGAMR